MLAGALGGDLASQWLLIGQGLAIEAEESESGTWKRVETATGAAITRNTEAAPWVP